MNLFQQLHLDRARHQTRRHFLQNCSVGLGGLWLASQGRGSVLQKDPANPLIDYVRRRETRSYYEAMLLATVELLKSLGDRPEVR